MHVAINAVFLSPPMGGIETYLRELCRELLRRDDAPQLTVYLNPEGHAKLAAEDWASSAELVALPRLGRPGLRSVTELTALGPMADRRGADVIHSVALTGPLASRARRVVTIADTVWITMPDGTMTARLWRVEVPLVTRRSHRVVAISHAGAAEVRTHLGVPDDKLDVVPLGYGTPSAGAAITGETELRDRLGLGAGPIVLNVGQKKPHRNLERLITAFAQVRPEVPGAVLVLPGPPNPEAQAVLHTVAERAGVGDAVAIPGFLDAADLEGLYAAAAAFVLPSISEGFGLPVLEAMARAVPVACSRDSAPGEVAGDAALSFDPLATGEIAAAIRALLTDDAVAARLRTAGPARAAQYTWARCAEETLDVYRRALA